MPRSARSPRRPRYASGVTLPADLDPTGGASTGADFLIPLPPPDCDPVLLDLLDVLAAAVSEPAAIAPAVLVAAWLLWRRRRRASRGA